MSLKEYALPPVSAPASILRGKVIVDAASVIEKEFVLDVKDAKDTGTPKELSTLHTAVTGYVADREPRTATLEPALNRVNELVMDSCALPEAIGLTETVRLADLPW